MTYECLACNGRGTWDEEVAYNGINRSVQMEPIYRARTCKYCEGCGQMTMSGLREAIECAKKLYDTGMTHADACEEVKNMYRRYL